MEKNGKKGGGKGAQSAMEYLVTYGWAILVIAIVIMALYALGVFRGPAVANVCLFPADFGCVSSFMYADGGLTVNIEQATSTLINITAIGCNTNKTTADMISFHPQLSLQIEGNVSISGNATTALRCYSGGNVYTAPIGTVFHGYLVLNYTDLQSGLVHTVVGGLTQRIEESNTQYTGSSSTTTGSTTSTSVTTTSSTSSSTSSTSSSTSSTSSTSIAYVPVTLTNTQSANPYVPVTLTNGNGNSASNFQQMVNITPSSYISYESAGLGNIRFYQGATELHSWCESGCNASSSKAVFWVLIPGGVPSGQSSINMTFLSVGTTYDNNYAGEAPELSPLYAEYDNGAKVFTSFYANFSGSSLNSKFSTAPGANSGVSDGVTITESGVNWLGVYTNSYTTTGTVVEAYGKSNSYAIGINTGAGIDAEWHPGIFYYGHGGSCTSSPTANANSQSISYSANNFYVISFALISGAPISMLNYSTISVTDGTSISSTCIGLSGTSGTTVFYYWFRVRAYPPSGVMPTATSGSLVTPQATPSTFQQMINISMSYTSNGEDANMQNVEFTAIQPASTSGNVPLYAWCESGCTSSSTSKWWVKLTNSIAANANTIIYMNFMPSNIMTSNTAYTGEAPQLSPTYAEYDNGASVFTYYQAWGGLSTLPNGWSYANSGGVSLSYSSAYTQLTAGGGWGGIYEAAPASTQGTDYVTDTNVSWSGANEEWGTESSTNLNNPSPETYSRWTIRVSGPQFFSNCGCATSLSPPFPSSLINSFFYSATTTGTVYDDYAAASPSQVTVDSTQNPTYFYYAAGYGSGNLQVYWTRTRTAPPNGAMPSYSLGAVQ